MNILLVQRRDATMYNNPVHGNQQWFQANNDTRDVKDMCRKYMNFYVIGQMQDGTRVEGIIEDMDDENVTMLVPEDVEEPEVGENRQFDGYGGYGGYGRPRRRFRRFRRRRFPFFVFPIIYPYPYYYPYPYQYPYY